MLVVCIHEIEKLVRAGKQAADKASRLMAIQVTQGVKEWVGRQQAQ